MRNFFGEKTLEQRLVEYERMRRRYPDRYPIILSPNNLTDQHKIHKLLVPDNFTVSQLIYIFRKRLDQSPDKALFLFSGGKLLVSSSTIEYLVENTKRPEGFLHITYADENVFGYSSFPISSFSSSEILSF